MTELQDLAGQMTRLLEHAHEYKRLADQFARTLERLPGLVREERQARGLSLRGAAAQSGVAFNTISRVEHGSRPDVDTLIALLQWMATER